MARESALKRWGRRIVGTNAVGAFVRASTLKKRLKPYRFGFGKVFEAGCGSGANLAAVLSLAPGAEVAGCDLSETELEKARTRLPRGRFFLADLTRERGAADNDLVVNVDVLEHIVDYEAALEGIASFARPGGLLALHTPNATQRRLLPFASVQEHEQDDHEREGFDLDELCASVERAGFEVVRRERTVGTWTALLWEIDFLLHKAKPLNFVFLPLWKLLLWPAIGADPARGNGIFILARRRAAEGSSQA